MVTPYTPKPGDSVQITSTKGTFEGILMPSIDPLFVTLKLNNGYNIGIEKKEIKGTKLLSTPQINAKKQTPVEHQKDANKGAVAILGCGGTIASKVEYKTGAVSPSISASELESAFPSLASIANISVRQLFSLFSEDMAPGHWTAIAKEVEREIKEGVQGVVLMHGTDTMGYTAAALSFMLQKLPVPVVFVGSQRSSDRPSSENEMNLLNAVYSATQNMGEVGVCMHAHSTDDICAVHRGVRVRKMHTSTREAFKSVNSTPLAYVDYKTNMFKPLQAIAPRTHPLESYIHVNENVALIQAHPGLQPKFVEKLSMFDGVVFAGTGLGHVATNPSNDPKAKSVLKEVKGLVDSGIPVVMAPQTLYGRLNMNVYTTGRLLQDAGVIGHLMDWLPETAFVKLSWVLGKTKDMKKVREMMLTNYAGEISQRSGIEQIEDL